MKNILSTIDNAGAVAAEAQRKFNLAEATLMQRRAAHRLAARVAETAEGTDLAAAIQAREAAKRALDAAEGAFSDAADAWDAALKTQVSESAAHRTERAPQVRTEAKKIAREIDAQLAAIEKLLAERGAALAEEIERDLCVRWWSGAVTNSRELGPAPYLGALCAPDAFRDAAAMWRQALADVAAAK